MDKWISGAIPKADRYDAPGDHSLGALLYLYLPAIFRHLECTVGIGVLKLGGGSQMIYSRVGLLSHYKTCETFIRLIRLIIARDMGVTFL